MLDDIAEYIIGEIAKGRGAETTINYRGKSHRIAFVPSPLFSTSGKIELLIACEKFGVHFYDGQQPLNRFKLVSSGYPLDIASQVEKLVREIMHQTSQAEELTAPSGRIKQLKARSYGQKE